MKKVHLSLTQLAFLIMLLGASFDIAQSNDYWISYTTSDGLAHNYVGAIAIDAQGTKWFGTDSGVSKFDGTTWTNYTTANGLVNRYVRAVAIETNEVKWFGTYGGGVSKFDGSNWTSYTTANGLAHNIVTVAVIDKDGTKWFGTEGGGVSKYDGSSWTTYNTSNGLPGNRVLSICVDSAGNKWVGTEGGGVGKFNGTNWTTYNTTNGLAENIVWSISADPEGNLWFGTHGAGVSKFDGTNWTTYTTSNGLVSGRIYSIAFDSEGNKWFASPSNGVSKFDDTNWTTYTTSNGLVHNSVVSMVIDSADDKWFGTAGGVSQFYSVDILSYDSLLVSIPDKLLVGPGEFPGDTITVPVYLDTVNYNNGNGIYSFQYELLYDDDLYECIGYDSSGTVLNNHGGLSPFTVEFRKDSAHTGAGHDTLRLAAASDDSMYYPNVPGTAFEFPRILTNLKFRISPSISRGDSTPLIFSSALLNEGTPAVSANNGSLKMCVRKIGDIDGDYHILPIDAVYVLRYVIHDTVIVFNTCGPIPPLWPLPVADVTGNGEVTALDASLILQYYVGKISEFPAGTYYKNSLPSNQSVRLALEWGEVQDGILTLALNADGLAEVYGSSFELLYDNKALEYLGTNLTEFTQGMTNVEVVDGDRIRLAMAGTEPLNGPGTLALLHFRVKENAGADEMVQLLNAVLNEEVIWSSASAPGTPKTYSLEQNYPNPFNPTTRIRYSLPETAQVQLVIYNLLGQRVRTLVNEDRSAGTYDIIWDGTNDQGVKLASGIYIYRIQAGSFFQNRKMVFLK